MHINIYYYGVNIAVDAFGDSETKPKHPLQVGDSQAKTRLSLAAWQAAVACVGHLCHGACLS